MKIGATRIKASQRPIFQPIHFGRPISVPFYRAGHRADTYINLSLHKTHKKPPSITGAEAGLLLVDEAAPQRGHGSCDVSQVCVRLGTPIQRFTISEACEMFVSQIIRSYLEGYAFHYTKFLTF